MKPTIKDAEMIEQLFEQDKIDEGIELKQKFDWSSELIEKDGKYGLKNCVGELLAPCLFEDFKVLGGVFLKQTDRVVAQQGGKWGVLQADGSGAWLVQPEYDYISFPNRLVAVKKEENWGVLDVTTLEFIIPLEQDLVYTPNGFLFMNGVAFFEKNGKTGMLDDYGHKTEAVFDEVDYDESIIKVLYEGKWGYADKDGNFTEDPDENVYYDDF